MKNDEERSDLVVYDAADLRRILGIGRPNAYRLAKQLGRRVGRRLLVARAALEQWLAAGGENDVATVKRRRRPKRATRG